MLTTKQISDLARVLGAIHGFADRQHAVSLIIDWLRTVAPRGFKSSEFVAMVEEFDVERSAMFDDKLPHGRT